ncbi:spore coat protein [Sporomusa sp. KB1]|jgi:spore coat protein CotF|uniref:spore coat protein n=1 Tax=Sporomusa sp. KB1 TaxID=943346 RepID=UPI001648CC2D|nr:spore coat protein [Sporomusa sp. KB1]
MSRQKQFSTATKNRLSDYDMLLDLMMTEKHLSSLYDQCVLEATTPMVSDAIERLQADTHNNVHTLFIAMQQHGLYNPEQAEERLLNRNPVEAYKKFDLTSESKYTGSSGLRGSGRRVSHGQRWDSLTN